MFKSLGTEFKVGLFALFAAATLLYMFFVLNPNIFSDTKYTRYYTILDNASGIIKKTHVKTNGITVGSVVELKLEVNATRIEFDVEDGVLIPVGSEIEVRSVGLLGDKHLEIKRGEDTGKFIEAGGYIPQSPDTISLETAVALVGTIARDIKKITSVFANVLGTSEGEEAVKNIVGNINGLSSDLKKTTEALRNVIGERERDLQEIVSSIRDGTRDLREFSAGLKDIMDQENRDRIDRILASFDETMADVKGGMRNINLIAEKVERGEGTIGRLVNDDDTLAELEGAIKDIREVLSPATKLQITVDYHLEARQDETTQNYFNLLFRTRPDRFYLLGVSDTKVDRVSTTTTTTTNASGEQETVEVIERDNALKFNFQFGKRWYDAVVRFGLFETTGGFAADYYFLSDKIRMTLEAYDFDTSDKTIRRTAHLKTYISVLFYNHIYVLGGIDDPTRTDPATGKANKEINYFVGAGLTFNDQDLKAIFGTAALAL